MNPDSSDIDTSSRFTQQYGADVYFGKAVGADTSHDCSK